MTGTCLSSTSVDILERFNLGSSIQWALVRGRSQNNPVLLLVQAGPGFPMIHEAQALEQNLGLEEHFRVVYWDQRGTGRSFVPDAKGALTMGHLVEDVRAMTRALCEHLGVSQLHVVGFSLGASLALLASAAEATSIGSLICVGPDVNLLESERFAYTFALEEAMRRGNGRAQRALRVIGDPPHDSAKRFMTRVKWVSNFGGIHRSKDFGALFRTNLARLWASPHYSLFQMVRALQGMSATQERLLPLLQGFDLLGEWLKVEVPVAIFQGRHDVGAPPHLTASLAERLDATVVWFEDSAHMPHEEEPQRFREELLRFIQRVLVCPTS